MGATSRMNSMRSKSTSTGRLALLVAVLYGLALVATVHGTLNRKVEPSSTSSYERRALNREYKDSGDYEADRIVSLPGQPAVDFAMFAGYVTVNEAAGRAHYYFFAEAEKHPEDKPLVFWFNGGQSYSLTPESLTNGNLYMQFSVCVPALCVSVSLWSSVVLIV